MSSPELLEAKLSEIEERAAKEKAKAGYIFRTVEENLEALKACVPEGTDDENVAHMLYEFVEAAIGWIESRAVRTVGVSLTYLSPEQAAASDHPLVRMGWASYCRAFTGTSEKPSTQPLPHVLTPTPLGIEIADGLRAVMGNNTLAEQREINRTRLDGTAE